MPKGGQVHSFYYGDPLFEVLDKMTWKDCISWFMDPFRLAVIFCARIGHNIFGPLLQMAFVILVKRTVVGKFKPGPLARIPGARVGAHAQMDHEQAAPSGDFRGAVGRPREALRLHHVPLPRAGRENRQEGLLAGLGCLRRRTACSTCWKWATTSCGEADRLVFPGDGISAEPVKIGRGGNVSRPVRSVRGRDAVRGRVPRLGAVAPKVALRRRVPSGWARETDPR